MSVSVCMCVFVRDHIFRSTRPMFTNFLCMLPIAVARSSIYDSDVTYDLTLVIYPTITLKKTSAFVKIRKKLSIRRI